MMAAKGNAIRGRRIRQLQLPPRLSQPSTLPASDDVSSRNSHFHAGDGGKRYRIGASAGRWPAPAFVAGAKNLTPLMDPRSAATSAAGLLHRYLQSAEVERRGKSDLGASHLKDNAIRILHPSG